MLSNSKVQRGREDVLCETTTRTTDPERDLTAISAKGLDMKKRIASQRRGKRRLIPQRIAHRRRLKEMEKTRVLQLQQPPLLRSPRRDLGQRQERVSNAEKEDILPQHVLKLVT